jgi:hypothetical protein
MKLLFVHPGSLVFTNAALRFEPLGLELLAAVARRAKHAVRIMISKSKVTSTIID